MNWTRAILALIVALLAVSAASAQSGGLVVRVVDSNGPLPGATVTISHDTGYVKTTSVLTTPDGVAEFPVLRPGDGYAIEVSFPGFGTRRMPDLKVKIGQSEKFTVQLAEEHTERVKVTAESDVVDLEETGQSTKFSDEFIQDLPVPGRFYQNVLTLAPGVQDTDGDGNPNVHGARERDFQTVVSGISNVDPLTGGYMSEVNPNSIEEIEVITAGAGAEFSRAQGGFARIIQTQGNNEFEGVFEFFFQSSLFDGTGAQDDSDLAPAEFQSITPGITVSGPIVKDKLWYRLSHQWTRREDPLTLGTGTVTQDIERSTHSDRLTWQVSPRNKLDFDFQADPYEIDGFGINAFTPKESSINYQRNGEMLSLTWTAPFSPKILIESQIAYQDLNTSISPVVAGLKNDCLGDESLGELEWLRDSYCTNLVTNGSSGSFARTQDDHSQRLTTRGDATIYGGRFWGMTHEFKVGFKTENERYFRQLEQRPGFQFFRSNPINDDDPNATPDPVAIMFPRIAVPDVSDITATGTVWGIYAQDQVKPLQNLTITLGLRVDREEINSNAMTGMRPDEEAQRVLARVEAGSDNLISNIFAEEYTAYEDYQGFVDELVRQTGDERIPALLSQDAVRSLGWETHRRPTNLQITNTNWAPRFSIAWDPWSNGKTKFAASAGRYYNNTPLVIPLIELEPVNTTLRYTAPILDGQLGTPSLDGNIDAAANAFAVDPNLKTPYNDEFTLSFERELWAETSISVSYIQRAFRDQFQDVDLNFLPGDFGYCAIATNASQPNLVESPGMGQELVDPYTGQTYIDTDPGVGDGFVQEGFTQPYDDCAGKSKELSRGGSGDTPGSQGSSTEIADNVPDLYRQNPGWGSYYFVGNLNQMDYQGIVFELTRRMYRSWEFQASYTLSKATGDGEDFNSFVGDDQSQIVDANGYQNYDQRHVVKMLATTITPWGFRLGGTVVWQSGLPYSQFDRGISNDQPLPLPDGTRVGGSDVRVRTLYRDSQRNNYRNVPFWLVNARLTKELNLGRGLNMQLSAEIYNLLNDGTYQVNTAQINGNNNDFFNFGRRWMLSMRLAF